MPKREMDGKKIAIFLLVVLLIAAVGYIAFVKFTAWRQTSEFGVAQYGYNQAILYIAQQAASCQTVPLVIGNQTINLVAVECLTQ